MDPFILRTIDANGNRLREALRVIEEYARLHACKRSLTFRLRELRHRCRVLEETAGTTSLLDSRDTRTDPCAEGVHADEGSRSGPHDLLRANFLRAQEAARVLEEYGKLTPWPVITATAKEIRFACYELEKIMREHPDHG